MVIYLGMMVAFGAAQAAANMQMYPMGQRWRGAQFELDYIYMIDDNSINQGRAGELNCGKKGIRIVQEPEIDRLLKPLYDRIKSQEGDVMKPEAPEYFANTKTVAAGRLISEYYDRRADAHKSYSYDLSKAPGVEQELVKTVNALCSDLDKK